MERGWHTCPQPGCAELTRGGPCRIHLVRPGHHQIYDQQWHDFAANWLRTHPRCGHCARPATEVDHIRPIRMGGARLDPHNVRSLCHSCHVRVTAQTRATPQRSRKKSRQ